MIAGCAGFLVSGQANVGYLPTVGPAPLRFRPDYKAAIHIVATHTAEVAQPSAPVLPVTVPTPILTPAVAEPTPAVAQPVATVEPSRPDGVVSPQMLLKYFGRGTNAEATAGAPLGFTPPRQVEPPSSKASYSTPQH